MSDEQWVRDVLDSFLGRVRRDVDAHLRNLTTEILSSAAGRSGASRLDLDRLVAEASRPTRAGIDRSDILRYLLDAVRRVDDASTLLTILEALGEGSAAEAARVAVLVVEGDTLRSWRHYGFAPGQGPVDLSVNASSTLAGAVNLRQATSVPPAANPQDPNVPRFLRGEAGHFGLLIPLVVGGAVVALLYAEGPEAKADQHGPPAWAAHVEVLVRHAASRLESVTSLRTVEFLTKPA